ncbi:MAG: hypothetical protein ABR923_21525 [Terracidiphilus sp.]
MHRDGDSYAEDISRFYGWLSYPKPGPGGWAAVLIRGSKSWEMSGASPWTTISEMELLAAVEALRSTPAGYPVWSLPN